MPAKQELNDPMITGIFAQSGHSVYAIGNGDQQDEGGPIVILHWDGYHWYRVAEGGLLAGGTTHAYANPGVNITAVLWQYGR